MVRKRKGSAADDPHQLHIDWITTATAGRPAAVAPLPVQPPPSAVPPVEPLVQRLPWDFTTSFPQPTDEAVDNGLLDESDRWPQNLRSLHEDYFAQCLATLRERDALLDARRKQIDPKTGSRPRTHAGRERLRTCLAEEPDRLDRTLEILIGSYADAFGNDAADAFRKAVTARHAGIAVVSEHQSEPQALRVRRTRRSTPSSALPVPRPLASSIKAGVFGHDENGKPIRPDAAEVRALTQQHADRMMDMDDAGVAAAATTYAEDFGPKAASQLERFVRHKQRSK